MKTKPQATDRMNITYQERYNVKNVPKEVRLAISKYCREKGITQSRYLSEDKRLKVFL